MSILMKGKRKSQSNNGSRSRAKHSSLPLPSHSFFKFTLNKSKGAKRVLVLLGDRHKSRRPSNSLDFLLLFCQEKCQFLRTVKNLHVPQKRSRLGAEGPARRERQRRKKKHFPHFSSPLPKLISTAPPFADPRDFRTRGTRRAGYLPVRHSPTNRLLDYPAQHL